MLISHPSPSRVALLDAVLRASHARAYTSNRAPVVRRSSRSSPTRRYASTASISARRRRIGLNVGRKRSLQRDPLTRHRIGRTNTPPTARQLLQVTHRTLASPDLAVHSHRAGHLTSEFIDTTWVGNQTHASLGGQSQAAKKIDTLTCYFCVGTAGFEPTTP